MRVTRSLALLLLVTAAQAAAAAAAGATLYGLNMIGNGPTRGALASIDPSTGNVTMVSGAQLPADSGTDDCRAIDSKRGLYYYLGDTHAGTTLVGLSLQTGTPKCQSTVPLKEIGFVGIGQSLKYDATRDRLILTGLVANSTGGVSHQILTADLGSVTAAAAAVAAAAAPSCATFTKAGTFPLAEQEPMLHSTAYDEKAQMLYTTIVPAKGEYALAVVDLQKQEMLRVELEGSPPVDEMTGMSWDIVTQSLIGTMQDGHNINLLSLDPSKLSVSLKGQWTVRQLLAPPKYALGGNQGDVHSYDPATGTWYAVLMDPPDPKIPAVTRIGVIDWTAGALLSAAVLTWPEIDGKPDPYKLLWQIALKPATS